MSVRFVQKRVHSSKKDKASSSFHVLAYFDVLVAFKNATLSDGHRIIHPEKSRKSRKYRHTGKHMSSSQPCFLYPNDCRPWEKQTRDKSSWNVPWLTPLYPTSEQSKLNRLDEHLETGKE
jgi:hypothetical protein